MLASTPAFPRASLGDLTQPACLSANPITLTAPLTVSLSLAVGTSLPTSL